MKSPRSKVQSLKSKVLAALVLLMAGALGSRAESTNAPGPARLSYDSFRMISDRNIFNPNRMAGRSGRSVTRSSSQPAARVEALSLVGIMAYEKGTYAFFDGTKTDYRQALQTGATIGEYHVAQVTSDWVQLTRGTNTYALKVGMQMRREDEGNWFLTETSDTPATRRVATGRTWNRSGTHSANGETTTAEDGSPELIVINGGETEEAVPANGAEAAPEGPAQVEAAPATTDPVLLRLMQRRQQMNR